MSTHGLVEIANFKAILDSVGTAPARELLPRATLADEVAMTTQDDDAGPLSCSALVRLHLALLGMEREAQDARLQKQMKFGTLKRLLVAETELTPHGGLRLWVLRPAGDGGQLLPKHNIRAREPVEVITEDSEEFDANQRAVVYRVTDYEVTLFVNDDGKLTLNKVVEVSRVDDDQMYWRMREVLQGLGALSGRTGRLREALFAERSLESAA